MQVFAIPNFLTKVECDDLIALTEKAGYEVAPITTGRGFEMRPDIRNNTRVILDDAVRAKKMWARFRECSPVEIAHAIGLNERFRFYRYDRGERFAPHYDGEFRRANGEVSRQTFMVYLNEGFEGGETNIIDLDAAIAPRTGLALVFDHDLLHEGAAVTKGRKYVLRSDIMHSAPLPPAPEGISAPR